MLTVNAYLNFNGNCRDAMTWYQQCLGGDLNVITVGESPMGANMPDVNPNQVMHAELKKDGKVLLLASDMSGADSKTGSAAAALSLECSSADEINSIFGKLS